MFHLQAKSREDDKLYAVKRAIEPYRSTSDRALKLREVSFAPPPPINLHTASNIRNDLLNWCSFEIWEEVLCPNEFTHGTKYTRKTIELMFFWDLIFIVRIKMPWCQDKKYLNAIKMYLRRYKSTRSSHRIRISSISIGRGRSVGDCTFRCDHYFPGKMFSLPKISKVYLRQAMVQSWDNTLGGPQPTDPV